MHISEIGLGETPSRRRAKYQPAEITFETAPDNPNAQAGIREPDGASK